MLYSTTDGHTIEICRRLASVISAAGDSTELVDLVDGPSLDHFEFDKIVIGASIRYGRHQKTVYEFIRTNRETLERYPNALFSVNVVARKPGKDTPGTNPYLRKFLARIEWVPQNLGVFAGKIDYPSLGPFDRTMIRFILWIGKGPTDTTGTYEFTDWDRVEEFGRLIARL